MKYQIFSAKHKKSNGLAFDPDPTTLTLRDLVPRAIHGPDMWRVLIEIGGRVAGVTEGKGVPQLRGYGRILGSPFEF